MYWSRTEGPPSPGETALLAAEACMLVGLCLQRQVSVEILDTRFPISTTASRSRQEVGSIHWGDGRSRVAHVEGIDVVCDGWRAGGIGGRPGVAARVYS